MHLLGHVRAGVVDHDFLGRLRRGATESIPIHRRQLANDTIITEIQIDESRPSDFDPFTHTRCVKHLDQAGRDVTRLLTQLLGQAHRQIGLVVAEFRVVGRTDLRINASVFLSQRANDSGAKSIHQDLLDVGQKSLLLVFLQLLGSVLQLGFEPRENGTVHLTDA